MTKEEVFREILGRYIENIHKEVKDLWNGWEKDLTKKEIYEVIGGIMARQATLTTQFVNSPAMWNSDSGTVILRALADNYITFIWICGDLHERSKKFIEYGLGQEKLVLEHRKQQMIKEGKNPKDDEIIESTEQWLGTMRYPFLTNVELGSWSGISTRKMAEESGAIDFYNYVYQPFSGSAHSTWNHIAKFNLRPSSNPLHKRIKIPIISDEFGIVSYIELAIKYLDKMLRDFRKELFDIVDLKSSYDIYLEELDKYLEEDSSLR